MRRLFMRLSLLLCRCDAWTCKWLYNNGFEQDLKFLLLDIFFKARNIVLPLQKI